MDAAGSRRLALLISGVNLGWALWAIVGGVYFLTAREVLGRDTTLTVFDSYFHGYNIVGVSLLACGVVSLLGIVFHRLKRTAAILCAVWCGSVAVVLQLATPGLDQGDIDAWLLLMCAFTCVCRWALLVLEPHVCG